MEEKPGMEVAFKDECVGAVGRAAQLAEQTWDCETTALLRAQACARK